LGFDLMFLPFPLVGFILMFEEQACRLAVNGNGVPRASRRVATRRNRVPPRRLLLPDES
jgi:hypothetical protein